MTPVVMSVIQKEIVNVGTGMRVRRISCVPSAQVLAAPKASKTPRGLPLRLDNSCHSSKTTPTEAAATPPHARCVKRSPNAIAPSTAEKMGMV